MDHVVAVVHDLEVVHQVQVFVVDQYRQQKALIVLKIEHHLYYDEHHVVHIHVHDHQILRKNVLGHLVQHMLMLLILIPNKFVQHYEILFKILLRRNVNEMIVLVRYRIRNKDVFIDVLLS